MNNSTNATSRKPHYDPIDFSLFHRIYYGYYVTSALYISVGTPLCVWFMAAILTSPDMRKRLRNQLLCTICLCYMLKSTVSGGLELSTLVSMKERRLRYNCYAESFLVNLRAVLEFAGSWQVVSLLFVYLAQISDYDPTSILNLTPLAVNVGKVVLLLLPFVFAIILIPSVGLLYTGDWLKKNSGCILYADDGFLVIRSLDYMIPFIISFFLLIVVVAFYHRRYHRRFSTSPAMQVEVMGRGRQVDNVAAYFVAVLIDIALRLPMTLSAVEMNMNINQRMAYNFISWMIVDARSIILPWCWLLLEDIRERIKIWRPWYRPAPGIDVALTYSRQENAGK